MADQPQLISLSIATMLVGGFIGRRDLVRGGARMLAAELVATAAKRLWRDDIAYAERRYALRAARP